MEKKDEDLNKKEPSGKSPKKKKPLIMKQPMMYQVLYALVPLAVASVYFFGWRSLLILAVVNVTGFFWEFVFTRKNNKPVTAAVFVTNFLFALSLPPTIPLWIAVVGISFGVIFGKMVFGGFGMNVFNPAISGRAFIYASFGYHMTSGFTPPASGFPGGFAYWISNADAVTKATPLVNMVRGEEVPLLNLLLGNTSGSLGETCAFLIIIGGVYLMVKKTANFRVVLGGIVSFAVLQGIFYVAGINGTPDPIRGMLGGSFLYGMMFMATDPVSASQTTNGGRWIYGSIIGALTALIRTFAVWPEGITFAILFANMFGPLINHAVKELKKRKKAAAA